MSRLDPARTPCAHPVAAPEGIDLIELAAEQGPAESIETLVARNDMSKAVAAAMALLPEEQRTAIILKEYHGMTFQEIADLQGCPLSTVKTRLYQGLTVLRRRLHEQGKYDPAHNDGAMTIQFRCDDKERLVSYLFDESADVDRAAVEAHLATCAACSDEVAALRRPARPRAVAAARGRARVPDRARRSAGAALVARAGLDSATRRRDSPSPWARRSLTYRSRSDTARSSCARGGPTPACLDARRPSPDRGLGSSAPGPVVLPASAGMSEQDVRSALAALEVRLRSEIASGRQAGATTVSASSRDRGPILQQVSKLVDESERRQQRELAFRLAQVVQDFDTQRRTDLVRIEQGFGQIESLTGQEAARQRQTIN